jgi:trafficking protein particle complex subunit 8
MRHLIYKCRRNYASQWQTASHRHIPSRSRPYIFPLYNPFTVDIILFWELPSEQRSGYLPISDLLLGAGHAALDDIVREAEEGKPKRNMFAETQREREEMLDALRVSEWNLESNPLVTLVHSDERIKHDFGSG